MAECCGGKGEAKPISRSRYLLGSGVFLTYHAGVGAALSALSLVDPRYKTIRRIHRITFKDAWQEVRQRDYYRRRIYLDHSATTPLRREVRKAMSPFLLRNFGNPSSAHELGLAARQKVEESRARVAGLLGAQPDEIVFTSGGTESDNLALLGVVGDQAQGAHIITSAIEHPAVISSSSQLEQKGARVTRVPVDHHGLVDLDQLEQALDAQTRLVSVMLVNNEVGTIQPLREIAALCRRRGALLHTDAVQAVGKMNVRVDELGVDLLSLSAHKLCGPKGIGALYVRRGTALSPLFHGGHQEGQQRAGTENVAGVVGLTRAMELAINELETFRGRTLSMRSSLESGLLQRMDPIQINGHPDLRLPNISNISFPGVDAGELLLLLDRQGIAVSSGSACTSRDREPSHVLEAMGLSPEESLSAIRFSLGHSNQQRDVDYLLGVLPALVDRLRQGCAI